MPNSALFRDCVTGIRESVGKVSEGNLSAGESGSIEGNCGLRSLSSGILLGYRLTAGLPRRIAPVDSGNIRGDFSAPAARGSREPRDDSRQDSGYRLPVYLALIYK